MNTLSEALSFFQQRVYQKIPLFLPAVDSLPLQLNRALHYVCEQPGKAIRPFLVYATGELFDVSYSELDSVAIAVELIHIYSLVHDDLPSMDDDDLRRGRPTCHKAFSEGIATLVGDGLQTLAFELLADIEQGSFSAELRLALVQILAKGAGISGMVKGQAIDIENIHSLLSESELESMHLNKTGALISACVETAALVGLNQDDMPLSKTRQNPMLANLIQYAKFIGLAFQIQDDVLDASATTEQLGKKSQKDNLKNKPNFVSLLGIEQAQQKAALCIKQALNCLTVFEPAKANNLIELTHYIIKRES